MIVSNEVPYQIIFKILKLIIFIFEKTGENILTEEQITALDQKGNYLFTSNFTLVSFLFINLGCLNTKRNYTISLG